MKARNNPTLLEYVLPADVPEEDEDFIEFYSEFNLLLAPVAFGLSYSRNKSLKWAAIHTLLAAPYVAYVLVDVFARKEAEEALRLKKELDKKIGLANPRLRR